MARITVVSRDGGDDAHATATVRAGKQVDGVHPPEQLRLRHAAGTARMAGAPGRIRRWGRHHRRAQPRMGGQHPTATGVEKYPLGGSAPQNVALFRLSKSTLRRGDSSSFQRYTDHRPVSWSHSAML